MSTVTQPAGGKGRNPEGRGRGIAYSSEVRPESNTKPGFHYVVFVV